MRPCFDCRMETDIEAVIETRRILDRSINEACDFGMLWQNWMARNETKKPTPEPVNAIVQ
jgi:hypothetical protein